MEFSGFYFDFSDIFLDLIPLKKAKRVYLTPREANVARHGHVAGPREPTWTPMWHLRCMNSNGAGS